MNRRSPHTPLHLAAYTTAFLLVWICSLAAIVPACAASIRSGAQIADDVCTTCHMVRPDQEVTPLYGTDLPSFTELANRPGMTVTGVLALLKREHSTKPSPQGMPFVGLTEEEMREVSRYLVSLKSPQK